MLVLEGGTSKTDDKIFEQEVTWQTAHVVPVLSEEKWRIIWEAQIPTNI